MSMGIPFIVVSMIFDHSYSEWPGHSPGIRRLKWFFKQNRRHNSWGVGKCSYHVIEIDEWEIVGVRPSTTNQIRETLSRGIEKISYSFPRILTSITNDSFNQHKHFISSISQYYHLQVLILVTGGRTEPNCPSCEDWTGKPSPICVTESNSKTGTNFESYCAAFNHYCQSESITNTENDVK